MRPEKIVDGLYWVELYWLDGAAPKQAAQSSEVKQPPTSGWGRAFLIDRGEKLVTLFDPYSFEGYQVSRNSYEYASIQPSKGFFDLEWHRANFYRKWDEAIKHSWQRDFETAVAVMRMLDLDIPQTVLPEGAEVKPKGGKEADDVLGLAKPVKRSGRRGQVLAFFMGKTRSVREAMAEFGITRSNVLSQLYLIQKDHGIGYQLVGDTITITLPAGCDDPFEPEAA